MISCLSIRVIWGFIFVILFFIWRRFFLLYILKCFIVVLYLSAFIFIYLFSYSSNWAIFWALFTIFIFPFLPEHLFLDFIPSFYKGPFSFCIYWDWILIRVFLLLLLLCFFLQLLGHLQPITQIEEWSFGAEYTRQNSGLVEPISLFSNIDGMKLLQYFPSNWLLFSYCFLLFSL